jgi:hypothetical protein
LADVRTPDALTYDPFRDSLWYVMGAASPADVTLVEASAETGVAEREFVVASTDSIAPSQVVAVAPDHSVWFTEGYGLVTVDPESGRIDRISLPLAVPGALPAATDPNAPIPGSWVSSLAFTDSSALVGRTNVPFLQQFSLDLRQLDDIAMPAGNAGPAALAVSGSAVVAEYRLRVGTGPAVAQTFRQVTVALPAGLRAPSGPTGPGPDGPLLEVRRDGNEPDLVMLSGQVVFSSSDHDPASVSWQPKPGKVLPLPFPVTTGEVHSPNGGMVPSSGRDVVNAAVQIPGGNLWLVRGGGSYWFLDGYTTAN